MRSDDEDLGIDALEDLEAGSREDFVRQSIGTLSRKKASVTGLTTAEEERLGRLEEMDGASEKKRTQKKGAKVHRHSFSRDQMREAAAVVVENGSGSGGILATHFSITATAGRVMADELSRLGILAKKGVPRRGRDVLIRKEEINIKIPDDYEFPGEKKPAGKKKKTRGKKKAKKEGEVVVRGSEEKRPQIGTGFAAELVMMFEEKSNCEATSCDHAADVLSELSGICREMSKLHRKAAHVIKTKVRGE